MYRRRVSILTAKSLRTLQVCRQPSRLESLKIITFSRNVNTATQISEIDNSSGLNGETYSDSQQNPDGVLNYNSTGIDSSNKSNQHLSGRPQNLDGFYSGNYRRIEQNPTGVYGQNPRTEFRQPTSGGGSNFSQQGFQHNLHAQNENFSRSGSLSSSSSDFGSRNDYQKNLVEHNGSDSAYRGENSSILHNSRIEGGVEAQPSQNGVSGHYQHNSNGYYGGNSGMSQQNFSGHYPRHTGVSQQNLANYYPGNEGNLQAGNFGMYPQSASGYDTGSQRSSSGYSRETVGQYQQNLSGFSNSQSQNGIVGPQEMGSLKPVEQSSDSSESSHVKGSIEELDSFCKEGKLKEAVEVLHLLEQQHVTVDLPRYLMLMNACGEDKSLEEAKSVHEHLVRSYPHLDVKTYNKILEMYAKCGSMDDATLVFEKMAQRNLTSWDTMITWLGKNGLGEDAVELFAEFKKTGMKPDGQMFLGVFHACSVVGDIVEGMLHFESMNKDYGIVHSMDHYVGVVNMLGSTGYLDEAMEFIEKMPIEPSIEIWETMMTLCRIHGNLELGDRCAEIVELLDPTRLDEQSKAGLLEVKASDIAKEKEKKKFAQSLLEARSRVHEYRAGDRSHPDHEKIYELLRGLKQLMKEAGYIPEVKFVLHDVDQETKEDALMAHSERLAFAQGLMNSSARSPIRIIKNLRVCGDCHNALKIASKLVGREIIMRDAKRFHHLKDGLCSCRDYW